MSLPDARMERIMSPHDALGGAAENTGASRRAARSMSLFDPRPPASQEGDSPDPPPPQQHILQRRRKLLLTCDTSQSPLGDLVPSFPPAPISPPTMWDEQLRAVKQKVQSMAPSSPRCNGVIISNTEFNNTREQKKPIAPAASSPESTPLRRRILERTSVHQANEGRAAKHMENAVVNKPRSTFENNNHDLKNLGTSQTSQRRLLGVRGSASWKSLLPGSGHSLKTIEVPEDDPGRKNISILHGGTLMLSGARNVSVNGVKTNPEAATSEAHKRSKQKKLELQAYIKGCCQADDASERAARGSAEYL